MNCKDSFAHKVVMDAMSQSSGIVSLDNYARFKYGLMDKTKLFPRLLIIAESDSSTLREKDTAAIMILRNFWGDKELKKIILDSIATFMNNMKIDREKTKNMCGRYLFFNASELVIEEYVKGYGVDTFDTLARNQKDFFKELTHRENYFFQNDYICICDRLKSTTQFSESIKNAINSSNTYSLNITIKNMARILSHHIPPETSSYLNKNVNTNSWMDKEFLISLSDSLKELESEDESKRDGRKEMVVMNLVKQLWEYKNSPTTIIERLSETKAEIEKLPDEDSKKTQVLSLCDDLISCAKLVKTF